MTRVSLSCLNLPSFSFPDFASDTPSLLQHSLYIGTLHIYTALFLANQSSSGSSDGIPAHPRTPHPNHPTTARPGLVSKVLATSVASCNVRLSVSGLIVYQTSPQCPFSTTQSAGATIGGLVIMASLSSKPQGPRGTSLAKTLILDSKVRGKLR